jgi:GDPmannose 4,6-dehydratase
MNNIDKTCLITGVTGQDGSYLAELLLSKGYKVHGIIRRASTFNTSRLDKIYQDPHIPNHRLSLHYGDVSDPLSIEQIMQNVKPDEIYHLGAQSHVKVSYELPAYTAQVDAFGTLNMLEAMRKHVPDAKFYNAATSELWGINDGTVQTEETPFYPRSPYGCAKLYSYAICRTYRESYNLFIVNGILFNHESERRGDTFVTQKTVKGLIKYSKDKTPFYLGNLEAKRDWGYAKDFVEGMYLMLQQEKPNDLILCTGETHTIKEFINECLLYLPNKENYVWRKDDQNRDILWNSFDNKLVIGIDPKYYRAAEVNYLKGSYNKAKEILGWEPTIKFNELVKLMMHHALNL